MNALLFRVLWKKKSALELLFASLGFLAGLFLFLFSLQVYLDTDRIFNTGMSRQKQMDYIVISKKMELGSAAMADPAFTDAEVAEIRSMPFTAGFGYVLPNAFSAHAVVDVFGRGFSTELFFEAVRTNSWTSSRIRGIGRKGT